MQSIGRLFRGKGIRQRLVIAFSIFIVLLALMTGIGAWRLFELQQDLQRLVEAPQAQALPDEAARRVRREVAMAAVDAETGRDLLVAAGAGVVLLGILYAWWITASVSRPLRRAAAVAKQVADGDLTPQLDAREVSETGHLLQALAHMTDNLRSLLAEVSAGARTVSGTSAQIAQGNLDLAQRTEEQAATLEETASSMEQLTATVTQNAQSARQASELAVGASQVAHKGGAVVDQVLCTMDGILDASRKITDIIGVIDSIAFQTNILALNAAVEAARAGDQGRGFAVVAAEGRNLAQRSATAAKEIKALIGDSMKKVQAGSNLADEAGHTMVEIVSSSEKVSALMAEIAAASLEQSSGIKQVNTAVAQMDHVVQQNASLVEEATAATESMKEQAGSLLAIVSRFKLGDHSETELLHGAVPMSPLRWKGEEATGRYPGKSYGKGLRSVPRVVRLGN